MKKIFLLLFAAIVAFGASATDYSSWYVNIPGGFNSWADNGVNPDSEGISTHVLAIGTTEFKVKVWDGSSDNWYSTGGAIETDTWVSISGNSDSNMTISGASDGETYTVNYDVVNNKIYVSKYTKELTYTYDLWGSFTSSNWASTSLTESDGVWTVTDLEVTYSAAAFGIRKLLNSTQDTWIAGVSGSNTITEAGKYTCTTSNTTNFSIAAGTWTLSFDPEALTLTVTGTASSEDPVYTYDLWGSFTSSNWASTSLTESDGVWTVTDLEVTYSAAAFGIRKLLNSTQDTWIAGVSGSNTITEAGKYTCTTSNTTNFSIAAGTWTLSFDPEALTLTVTGTASSEDPVYTYKLNGSFTSSDWAYVDLTETVDGSGVWAVENLEVTQEANFGISKQDATGSQTAWIWSTASGTTITEAGTYNCGDSTDATDGGNFTIAAGTWSFLFDTAKLTLTISGETAGIENIDVDESGDAEYYNLQGVRVSNPENGIFIMRCGNKVSKVVK